MASSPFPGMDPYLEQPAFWSSFHSRLIVAIANVIESELAAQYYVEVETRTYLNNEAGSLLIGIPDAVVVSVQTPLPNSSSESKGKVTMQARPQKITLPMPETVQERYLEIREIETGTVITTLEVLSPKNKRTGPGRIAYEKKRQQVLGSFTHLVELDLLRGGEPMVMLGDITPTDYRAVVSLAYQRPAADLYGFTIREPMPVFPVPLQAEAEAVLLPLQTIFEQVYQQGRYQTRIHYSDWEPQPPLSAEDYAWMVALFKQKGLR
ncbi:MAG: DUF4058 family protein [Cyanothece sp. SIO1E1]|nr:DUF4058 family protein [Cyanothece sp. SIO1E1]